MSWFDSSKLRLLCGPLGLFGGLQEDSETSVLCEELGASLQVPGCHGIPQHPVL